MEDSAAPTNTVAQVEDSAAQWLSVLHSGVSDEWVLLFRNFVPLCAFYILGVLSSVLDIQV